MAKKPNRRSVPISITIDAELLRVLDNLADAQRVTRSQLIGRMVHDGLEGEKVTTAILSNRGAMEVMGKLFSDPNTMRAIGGAMGNELDDKGVADFNRALSLAAEQANKTLGPKKPRKGRKS